MGEDQQMIWGPIGGTGGLIHNFGSKDMPFILLSPLSHCSDFKLVKQEKNKT